MLAVVLRVTAACVTASLVTAYDESGEAYAMMPPHTVTPGMDFLS